jgi:hypothetical protein
MTVSSETEIEPALIGDGAPAIRRREPTTRRSKPVELAWPSTPSERERTFERWESLAMRCLRNGKSDFALIISVRKLLKPDGSLTASNRELSCAAGCSAKTLEIDLARLRASGLIISAFHSLKGFSGRRRVIRLSLPTSDEAGGRI